MSMGPLMLDLQGTQLSPEERELLQHPLVAGVILFTRNYESVAQLTALCQAIRQSRHGPLLIAVDHEGGRVQRFRTEFTLLPSMGKLGELYDQFPNTGLKAVEECGWLMAAELLSVGIDLSFAPVLDLNKGINPAIQDRAFHRGPEKVILLAKALMQGMRQAGMAATGKHFPGHGSIDLDSHFATPIDPRPFADIKTDDLRPFQALIAAGIAGIMPAHIIFSEVDPLPVGFSAYWLQTVLRQQYHFSGVIFSDDLNMQGANTAGGPVDRALMALNAGCDIILMCNNRESVIAILDNVPQTYEVAPAKYQLLQGKFSMPFHELIKTPEWQLKQKSLGVNSHRIAVDF